MSILYTDYMSSNFIGCKPDNVNVVAEVLPSVEYAAKQGVSAAQQMPGAKWFNASEQYLNGVLVDQTKTLGAYVKFQCCPSSGTGHSIKVSYNYGSEEGLCFIKDFVDKYVPIGWDALHQTGNVTRFDVAVDLKGVKPSDFLWASAHGYKKSVIFSNDTTQQIETAYLGSEKSEMCVVVYDRRAAVKAKGKEPLIIPSSLPDHNVTRVELRFRPKKVNQVQLLDMQPMVDEGLKKVHVLKAHFLNPEKQSRLLALQRLGYQRHLLNPSACPQLLTPDERQLVAMALSKRSLFDLVSQHSVPLTELYKAA